MANRKSKYQLEKDEDGLFCVKEQETDVTILKYASAAKANKQIVFLNKGGGFAGFTPSFFYNNSNVLVVR